MTQKRTHSLSWRLAFVLMLAQIVVIGGLGWYIVRSAQTFHLNQTLDKLQTVIQTVEQPYHNLIDRKTYDLIDERIKTDGEAAEIRLTMILPDGVVIGDSVHDPATMGNHLFRKEIAQAFELGEASSQRYSETLGVHMLYWAKRINTDDQTPVAVFRGAVAVQDIYAQFGNLRKLVLTALAVTLVVTLVITALVSRAIGSAVSEIAEGAKCFASGQLTHQIKKPAIMELASLSDSLNEMADRISKHVQDQVARENELQAMLRSIGSGLIAIKEDQRIISMNRESERIFGVKEKMARGRLMQEVIRNSDLNRLLKEMTNYNTPEIQPQEVCAGKNHNKTIRIKSEKLLNANEEITGILLIFDDVTQLRQLESLRADFAGSVSHELRTPITNIMGYVETLIDHTDIDADNLDQFLNIIHKNASRLNAIVEDLLALTRLESPDSISQIETQVVPVAKIVQHAIDDLKQAATGRSVKINCTIQDNMNMRVAPLLAEQAMGNLIANAIQYTYENTTVIVSAQYKDDGFIAISVVDEGPGISPIHQQRVFERFYRIDKARSKDHGGTGLGLAIVKHIAIVHSGAASVTSEPGQGSTFTISFPAG